MPDGIVSTPSVNTFDFNNFSPGPSLDETLDKELSKIKKEPGQEKFELHPLDPTLDTGRWLHTFWRNLAEPVEEAWASPTWRIPKTGVALLGSALNVIPSMVTTTLGFDHAPSMWDAATQYADGTNLDTPSRWGLQGLGIAADLVAAGPTDPLRMLTFGAKPMAKTAEKILAEGTPEIANIRNSSRLLGLQKYTRPGAELTEQNIQGYVVPKMVQSIIEGTPAESTLISKDYQTLRKSFGDYDITDHVFGHKRNEVVPGIFGNKSYEQMLNSARSMELEDLREFSKPPDDILKNPSAPLHAKLDSLAKYTAFAEKAIWDERAMTRLYLPVGTSIEGALRNFKEGIPIAPSPTRAISSGFGKIFGKWEEQAAGLTPLEESGITDHSKKTADFMSAGGYRLTPAESLSVTKANPLQVEQFVSMYQTPFTGFRRVKDKAIPITPREGIITNPRKLMDFVVNEVGALPEHLRIQHLENIQGTYNYLRTVTEQNPNLRFATEIGSLRKACTEIDKLVESVKDQISAGALTDKRYKKLYSLLTETGVNEHQFRLHELLDETKALAENLKNRVSGQLYKKQGSEVDQLSTLLSSTSDIPQEMTRFIQNFNTLNSMTVSYPYAMKAKMDLRELHNVANEIHSYFVLNHEAIREQFLSQSTGQMNSLRILGNMLRTKSGRSHLGRLKDELTKATNYLGGNVESLTTADLADRWATQPPSAIQAQRNVLEKKLNAKLEQMATNNQISAQDLANIKNFLSSADHKTFAGTIYSLDDLSKANAHLSLDAAILDRLTEPFQKVSQEIQKLTNTEFKSEFVRLGQDLASYQATYQPREIMAKLMAPGGWVDQLNSLQDKIFRKAKFGPNAAEIMEKYVEANSDINPLSEKYGLDFSKNVVVKNAGKYAPHLAGKVSMEVESKLNNLVGDYVQFFYTRSRFSPEQLAELSKAAVDPKANPSVGAALRQLTLAEGRVQSSLRGLAEIFGSDTAAKAYAEDVRKELSRTLDGLYKEEVRLNLARLYRGNYVPYAITGDFTDKQLYRKIVDSEDLAAGLSARDKAIVERSFGPSFQRKFPDAAAVLDYIDQLNKERALSNQAPLKLGVESNLAAVVANRKKLQLRALNNRQLVNTLETVLPPQMRVIKSLSEAGAAKLEERTGFSDLGKLIPSMSGKWINSDLYNYLEKYIPRYEQENKLFEVLRKVQSTYTRFQVQYSLVHLKNLASLVAIAGTEPGRILRILQTAMEGQASHLEQLPGMSNLFRRMSLALEESELYKAAVRSGVTHFRGEDQFRSVVDNVKRSMTPKKFGQDILSKGPFTTVIFDVMDRATKMALYEQLLERGLPGRMAASWVNHYLIDYTAKNLDPSFKKHAHAVMPFVSWNIQNAMLHIPNMIENPRKYAMIGYLRNYLPSTIWKSNPFFAGNKTPEVLADAMFIPHRDSKGNQTAVYLDLPWDKYIKLMNNSIVKYPTDPWIWRSELVKFLVNKTYYSNILREALDPVAKKREEKETLKEKVFGTPTRPGLLEESFWGIYPTSKSLYKAVDSVTTDGSWSDFTPAILDLIVGRTAQVTPTGRIQR